MPEADHSVTDTDVATWDSVMAVNVRGVFLGCKYAIPAMIDGGGGSIINIASFVAILGCSVPQDAYTASKGAVLSLTRSLAVQFGPEGIRTNAILPGPGRDAAADGLAGQGRGGQAPAPGSQSHRSLRDKPDGDRASWRSTSSLGRVALDQRRVDSSSTAESASTTSSRSEAIPMTEEDATMASGRIAIGIDVGGSGIKAAVVDVESGQFRSDRIRVATPDPSTPEAVIAAIGRISKRLARAAHLGPTTPVGVGLPGVTLDGTLKFAGNIDQAWIGFPVVERLRKATGRPVTIVNDADAAGIAEMRFGVGKGRRGSSSS